jgi:hypothetical protein
MLTQDRLKQLLIYNPETGDFVRRIGVKGHEAGEVVGSIKSDGRVNICVDYKMYKAHRLAWLYMTGLWPENQIDHIDGNSSNNRFNNLREATASQNIANRLHNVGESGLRGVDRHGRGWRAKIKVNRKAIYLGIFDTKEEASAVYKTARDRYFGEFNPTK